MLKLQLLLRGSMSVEVTSLLVALASLITSVIVGWRSIRLTKHSLKNAEAVARRAHADWCQRKWFDLYLQSCTAYDRLDQFQFVASPAVKAAPNAVQSAYNVSVLQFRKVHALAEVFPKCKEIDDLFAATSDLKSEADAGSADRLQRILNASEGIRSKALISPDILDCGR